jgi:glycosyltransferase involved in cell wall biosynthesis
VTPTATSLRTTARARRGRALLSYITRPFGLDARAPDRLRFSNIGLAWSIANTIRALGFDVDVIDYDDRTYETDQRYDLAIVHGGINYDHLADRVLADAAIIYFSTGSYWRYHNAAEVRRFEALRQRRGIALPLDRFIGASEERVNREAASIICLGNEAARDTYRDFPNVTAVNSAAVPDDFIRTHPRDYRRASRRFLFFGSAGSVHKGLDLALEAFADLDADLFLCGSIEPEFANAYARELAQPNVHNLGWVSQRSRQFYRVMRDCAYVLLPSASEGQPGGVIECMHRGLIPVVSSDAHIDTAGFGLTLTDCSVDGIRAAAEELMLRPTTWHAEAARMTFDVARSEYVPERFEERFRAGLLKSVLGDAASAQTKPSPLP